MWLCSRISCEFYLHSLANNVYLIHMKYLLLSTYIIYIIFPFFRLIYPPSQRGSRQLEKGRVQPCREAYKMKSQDTERKVIGGETYKRKITSSRPGTKRWATLICIMFRPGFPCSVWSSWLNSSWWLLFLRVKDGSRAFFPCSCFWSPRALDMCALFHREREVSSLLLPILWLIELVRSSPCQYALSGRNKVQSPVGLWLSRQWQKP